MQNAFTPPENDRPLDLNTSSAEALHERCGLSLAIARRIVDDRDRNGPFVDARDVGRVPGVGSRTLRRIAESTRVEPPTVRPASLLPFRPVDPARLAQTVAPGGRRSRRPRVRIATEVPVVAPRPIGRDVLRALPVMPTGWPEREVPRPVPEEAPVVRRLDEPPSREGAPSAGLAAPTAVTIVPGTEGPSRTMPSARGTGHPYAEELCALDLGPPPMPSIEETPHAEERPASQPPTVRETPPPRLVAMPPAPEPPPPSPPRIATPLPSAPPRDVVISAPAVPVLVLESTPPAATTASEAPRAPARSVAPAQPKEAKAAPPRRMGPWVSALVSLAIAAAAGVVGFQWTVRQATTKAARESATQVDAVRGVVSETQERVGGLEGRAASWDRGVEKIAGLASTAQQQAEDIDALRTQIAKLEGDVGTSHDRQRRLQATLELAAIREQTAWAFPPRRPPAPEPGLAAAKAEPNPSGLSKRVHASKGANPFAPTRPLPK